jgi:hypothetical protein
VLPALTFFTMMRRPIQGSSQDSVSAAHAFSNQLKNINLLFVFDFEGGASGAALGKKRIVRNSAPRHNYP